MGVQRKRDTINPYDPETTPDGTPPAAPRKRRHYIRWTLAGLGALVLLFVVIGIASGGSKTPAAAPSSHATATASPVVAQATTVTDPSGMACAALDDAGYCPGDDPAPPTPTVNPATTVTFTVTGWGNPSVTYGSDSDNRDGGGTLGQLSDGNALPWTRSLKFDGNASYYSLDAQLEGSGDISCKIVVSGPGDAPLTVSHGHASGGYNICSAQAAPSDSTGTSWQNEG
jgi:hypothetical protein